ncbi:MAG: glycoside hydrolase family 172 protein [Eubacteriales bacterium]
MESKIHSGTDSLCKLSNAKSRSLSAENISGEKGKGAMATEGVSACCAHELGQGWKINPYVIIQPGEVKEIGNVTGPGMIKQIWMVDNSNVNRSLILRIYWDGSEFPSVETPLCDFFASADYQEYRQLTSMMVCVNPKRAFNCYWEMPFYKSFRITIENITPDPVILYYQINYILAELPEGLGYFHAQFRRTNPLPYKEVYTILDNVNCKGHYVGTYMFWGVNNNGWWGEGEIKFYIDGDDEFPTICGTGTEDYFCGSYNFDTGNHYQEFCTPYSGLSKVIKPDGLYRSQTRFSLYRWHICDPVYFDENIRVTIQALGWRPGDAKSLPRRRYLPLQDDISSVAFFYADRICDTFPALPDKNDLEII